MWTSFPICNDELIHLQDNSSGKKDEIKENFCPLESISIPDLNPSTQISDTVVRNEHKESNASSSHISKHSLPKIVPSKSQENAFHNSSSTTISSSSNKGNYSTGNTSGHTYENSIQTQFPNGLSSIPPPPIPPRSATRH